MGNKPSIDVWFGLSNREDYDLVSRLCKLLASEDVDGVEVGMVYNCFYEEDFGWGAIVKIFSPSSVHPMSDIHPTGDKAERYSGAALEALRRIIPDEADAIFQKMEFHVIADYF